MVSSSVLAMEGQLRELREVWCFLPLCVMAVVGSCSLVVVCVLCFLDLMGLVVPIARLCVNRRAAGTSGARRGGGSAGAAKTLAQTAGGGAALGG